MVSEHNNSQPSATHSELELLQLILCDDPYPWTLDAAEAEVYLTNLEDEFNSIHWLAGDIEVKGQVLAATLDEFWTTVPAVNASNTVEAVPNSLFQQFAAYVPETLLAQIMQKARQVVSTKLSLADQLVLCVQDVLPNWGEEDLQVFARPFAYAMRGPETEMLEGALRTVRYNAWTELSGVEQARLSLAIARYALAQMPNSESPRD